ncbi:hypothetical protein [Wolbachia endosymbiont (group A) of Clivina fossor]|uniref:hypothetical protein n=1 Tax=Wolbachia endosymbiont (group A) of Clivina fossor TaxID=3066133 RepID=UPI003132DF03
MPNTETVRALVDAFNVNNYDFNAVKTNFTLQSRGKKDYIVVSFDKSMDTYQCRRYLDSIKRKIIREFYGIEESNDAEILDTAKLIFDVNSFPFNISDRDWSWDEQHGLKFVTPVDEGVIFNLKSHLAFSLKKDVQEDMSIYITAKTFNKKKYLWCGEFPNKELRQQFEREFLSRTKERYENVPKNPLKVEGNSVYIRNVFDDARFIDSVTRRAAWRIGIDLGIGNDVDHSVMLLKDSIMNSVYQSTKMIVVGFICASPLNREEASILIPLVLGGEGKRILTSEEALKLNYAFNGAVLNDIDDKAQGELSADGRNGVYGIDFSNKEISHCVITKIIESSVINKDHELAIDPELVRALSPVQSPEGMPNRPSSCLTESLSTIKEFPTRGHGEELERSPRGGSERKQVLHNPVNLAGPSKGFSPSPQLNSIAVNHGGSEPSSSVQSVSAAKNVQAGTSAWDQPVDAWSFQASSAGPSLWSQSGPSSWKGTNESTSIGNSTWYVSLSGSPDLGILGDYPKGTESICGVEPEKQQVTDKSDRESSDECSEAKSQESESPKKHGGGLQSIIKSFLSSPSKPKQHDASLKRCDVGRDTMHSSVSAPGDFVTEKPPLSERSASERRAKNNSPSKETSPVHSTIIGSIPGLPSQGTTVVESNSGLKSQKRLDLDQREELRPFLSSEMKEKLDSNSFSPGEEQHLYLTHTPSGKCEITKSFESPEENLMRCVNAQLPSSDNLSSEKVNRDSGFCSIGSASPAVPHKGSVSSECKECSVQQAKYMSKALEKN